jgi:hypothetical protein
MQGAVDSVPGNGTLQKMDRAAIRAYQLEDEVNKLAMYITLRERGWTPEEAKQGVNVVMPDYNQPMPKAWKFLRDSGISPFIAWNYYTVPKILRLIRTKEGATKAAVALGSSAYVIIIQIELIKAIQEAFKAVRNKIDVVIIAVDIIPLIRISLPFTIPIVNLPVIVIGSAYQNEISRSSSYGQKLSRHTILEYLILPFQVGIILIPAVFPEKILHGSSFPQLGDSKSGCPR